MFDTENTNWQIPPIRNHNEHKVRVHIDLLTKEGSRTLRNKSSTKTSRSMCSGSGDKDMYVFDGRIPVDGVMPKALNMELSIVTMAWSCRHVGGMVQRVGGGAKHAKPRG